MKNLLFFLLAIALFASCSNSDEGLSTNDGKKYKVSFKVDGGFTLDAQSLKSEVEWPNKYVCEYTIYKESGEAIDHDVLLNKNQLSFELPNGKYKIAILAMAAREGEEDRMDGKEPVLEHSNFETDYIKFPQTYYKDALIKSGFYFETIEFTVAGADNTQNVELLPIWSEIYMNITDAATCNMPEGTNRLSLLIEPYYKRVGVKDKVPTTITDPEPLPFAFGARFGITVDDLRAGKTFPTYYIHQSKDITIKLLYWDWKGPGDADRAILEEKLIFKGNLEEGKCFTLTGKLGNTSDFNLSLKSLVDGGEIPFE